MVARPLSAHSVLVRISSEVIACARWDRERESVHLEYGCMMQDTGGLQDQHVRDDREIA